MVWPSKSDKSQDKDRDHKIHKDGGLSMLKCSPAILESAHFLESEPKM